MKKKINLSIFLPIILVLAMTALYVYYNVYYDPNKRAYDAYLNVFEEIDKPIEKIDISTINHNIVIKRSNDDKVKIAYYQKLDNSNIYNTDNKTLKLQIVESVESIDDFIFRRSKNIDVITVYLPIEKTYAITIHSIYGGLNIDDINARSLKFDNVNGDILINNSTIENLQVESNGGNVKIDKLDFNTASIFNVTGTISFDTVSNISDYKIDVMTTYGSLTINNSPVIETDEEGNSQIVNHYVKEAISDNGLSILSTRSDVTVYFVESEDKE